MLFFSALKLVHVDMYTHRLRERARRKRVGRDYQLVSNFFNSGTKKDKLPSKKKLTKEEKYVFYFILFYFFD